MPTRSIDMGVFNYDDPMGIEIAFAKPEFDIKKLRNFLEDFSKTASTFFKEAGLISMKSTDKELIPKESSPSVKYDRSM